MAIVTVGWSERIVLPGLSQDVFLGKIDTGAFRSALHAQNILLEHKRVRFQLDGSRCELPLLGKRVVTSSCGCVEKRFLVETVIRIGSYEFKTQFTLTDRSGHRAKILLGRRSTKDRFLVDPKRRFVLS